MVGEGILGWIRGLFMESDSVAISSRIASSLFSEEELDKMWAGFTEEQKGNPATQNLYDTLKEIYSKRNKDIVDPFTEIIAGWIDVVKDITSRYKLDDPENAFENATKMAKEILALNTIIQAIEFSLGALPNDMGTVAATKVRSMWTWLGFGAIINAVAHDPVKIGVLRPWMRTIEATYRNRSLDQRDAMEAYIQRSLSESRVVDDPSIPEGGELRDVDGKQVRFYDLAKITDADMDAIEVENDAMLDLTMAQYGTTPWGVSVMQDYATRSLSFGNLSQLARMGHHQKDIALFSLWGYGLDRRLMKRALEALETIQTVSLWKGFRSMVEPGYVQGLIDADDMKEYWTHILVPEKVQEWAMVRLTKSREKYLAKEQRQQDALTKDLTKADWTTAFVLGNIDESAYKTKLSSLGYDDAEVQVLVANAKSRIKNDTVKDCKKLPLSDYELAHRNGLLTIDQVLDRMKGEYCQTDIDLESQLLQIDDLTTDAPARERDLTASTVTTAYVESVKTKDETTAYLGKLGYDDQEISTLMSLAEIKKDAYEARYARQGPGESVQKERDLTLAQLTTAYVDNIIDEAAYTTDLGGMGYDTTETAILIKLAQIKKKLPTVTGLKRLPLGDYEKAWKYAGMTIEQVLDRMRGEYREEDIQLEKLLLEVGKT